jgi:hypothetical protein
MLPLRLLWDKSTLWRVEMLNKPGGKVEERRLFAAAKDRRKGDRTGGNAPTKEL